MERAMEVHPVKSGVETQSRLAIFFWLPSGNSCSLDGPNALHSIGFCWHGRVGGPDDFFNLTKAFNLVSKKGLFQLLKKISCPPQLLSIFTSFYEDMQDLVSYDRDVSEPFAILSGVKQGCVLAIASDNIGSTTQVPNLHSKFICNLCGKDCHARMRLILLSHSRTYLKCIHIHLSSCMQPLNKKVIL